jgi:hypothetical protein
MLVKYFFFCVKWYMYNYCFYCYVLLRVVGYYN